MNLPSWVAMVRTAGGGALERKVVVEEEYGPGPGSGWKGCIAISMRGYHHQPAPHFQSTTIWLPPLAPPIRSLPRSIVVFSPRSGVKISKVLVVTMPF